MNEPRNGSEKLYANHYCVILMSLYFCIYFSLSSDVVHYHTRREKPFLQLRATKE